MGGSLSIESSPGPEGGPSDSSNSKQGATLNRMLKNNDKELGLKELTPERPKGVETRKMRRWGHHDPTHGFTQRV
jgi:hypothetical protein